LGVRSSLALVLGLWLTVCDNQQPNGGGGDDAVDSYFRMQSCKNIIIGQLYSLGAYLSPPPRPI
jgi:hypothetical protein